MERLNGFYTITQAAELLGMSEGGVRRLLSDGKIAATHLPGMVRPKLITQAEIDRYLQERVPRGRPQGSRDSRPRKPVTPEPQEQ